MGILFANSTVGVEDKKLTARELLGEQILNSGIVAGIAAIATWTGTMPDWYIVGKMFVLTFLIEMRRYRDLL